LLRSTLFVQKLMRLLRVRTLSAFLPFFKKVLFLFLLSLYYHLVSYYVWRSNGHGSFAHLPLTALGIVTTTWVTLIQRYYLLGLLLPFSFVKINITG